MRSHNRIHYYEDHSQPAALRRRANLNLYIRRYESNRWPLSGKKRKRLEVQRTLFGDTQVITKPKRVREQFDEVGESGDHEDTRSQEDITWDAYIKSEPGSDDAARKLERYLQTQFGAKS